MTLEPVSHLVEVSLGKSGEAAGHLDAAVRSVCIVPLCYENIKYLTLANDLEKLAVIGPDEGYNLSINW